MAKIVRNMLARSMRYFTARFAEPVNFRQSAIIDRKELRYV